MAYHVPELQIGLGRVLSVILRSSCPPPIVALCDLQGHFQVATALASGSRPSPPVDYCNCFSASVLLSAAP
jgi:hypothetical protein